MNFLFAAMALLWFVVLLYVVFLVNKQKTLERQLQELKDHYENQG